MITFSVRSMTKELLAELPERTRRVLADRFGLTPSGERKTLEAIGSEYGITRERIRQIERHGLQSLAESDSYKEYAEAVEELRAAMHSLGIVVPEHVILEMIPKSAQDHNHLLFVLAVAKPFSEERDDSDFKRHWHIDSELSGKVKRALKNLYHAIESDKLVPEQEFIQLFARFLKQENVKMADETTLLRWLGISKRVGKNPLGEWGRTESPHVRIRNTRDYAYLTLKRHGSPMHFTEVAKTIEKLFKRTAHPATTHNELIKDARFVLVGRGLYALKEWGYAPGVVRDVIRNVLEREGALTREEIIERVKRERYVKDATISVNLQHRHFVRLPDGKYALAPER